MLDDQDSQSNLSCQICSSHSSSASTDEMPSSLDSTCTVPMMATEENQMEISVPDGSMRFIVGLGNQTILEIQSRFSVRCHISCHCRCEKGIQLRSIVLKGHHRMNVEFARQKIAEIVANCFSQQN